MQNRNAKMGVGLVGSAEDQSNCVSKGRWPSESELAVMVVESTTGQRTRRKRPG